MWIDQRFPRLIIWLIFILSLGTQLISYTPFVNLYDEGIVLTGASLILDGKLPYRDFWTMYGPGSFYVTSFLFFIFEENEFFVRIIGMISKSFIVASIYIIIDRFTDKLLATIGALILLGILIGLRQDAFPVFPAIAFSLAAMEFFERGIYKNPWNLVASGLCSGLTAFFRHDFGFYMALTVAATIFAAYYFKLKLTNDRKYFIIVRRIIIYYGFGLALIVAPAVLFFLHNVPLSDLYENLIFIPSHIYPETRRLPWPGFNEVKVLFENIENITKFSVYIPLFVFVFALAIIFRGLQAKSESKEKDIIDSNFTQPSVFFLLLLFASLFFMLKGAVRVSPVHMIQSIVFSFPVLFVITSNSKLISVTGNWLVKIFSIFAFGILACLSGFGFVAIKDGVKGLLTPNDNFTLRCINPVLPTIRCAKIDLDYMNTAKFVRENTAPEDLIYVGVGRHDKIFINAVAFYFLSERRPATKWYELHPGVQTQARIQVEMISEMKRHPPQMIILDERWDTIDEPNASRLSSGARLLDNYLESSYKDEVRFGTIRVLSLKESLRQGQVLPFAYD